MFRISYVIIAQLIIATCILVLPNAQAAPAAGKACTESIHVMRAAGAGPQTGPGNVSRKVAGFGRNDPGFVRLDDGCHPLNTPLPPQGAGKTFSP
ncbi:hypothetical protein [Aestuariivirga litoralis]|uniref:hypothetical protein n=1 Tax=Aestuariivirga litoralis TaxID=2650924 RepID=UPI0018C6C6A1|nr:hypothetical protein [Aestuariivirga litoralis]MBG1231138.1 hypothetical protein [Aestuariivirga litoralis]